MKKRILIIISIIVFIILVLGITKVLKDAFNAGKYTFIILEGNVYNDTTLENTDIIEEENNRKEYLNEMIKINN